MGNFSSDVLQIFPASLSAAVNIGNITSMGHNLNNEVESPETGDPYAEEQNLVGQSPVIDFTTGSIDGVLSEVGYTGLVISPDTGKPGVVGFLQKHDPSGTDARAASTHQSITYANGYVQLNTLTATRRSLASLTGAVHFRSTDTNPAPVISNSATLPSSPAPVKSLFGLGKPTVLGTVIHQVESISVNFNPQISKPNDADNIYPTEIDPQFFGMQTQIVARTPELLGAGIPISGLYTNDDTALRLIRRVANVSEQAAASNGAYVDFTTSVHHLYRLNGLVLVGQHFDVSGRATGLTQIDIYGRRTGSVPFVPDLTNPYDLTTTTPA